mmetsp:Transcript_11697/g.18353  ORF Transcript_11697/g.18353 Transcript_11697/m.18353 type:complete len:236 (-) Transcript_11697:24-731(-)
MVRHIQKHNPSLVLIQHTLDSASNSKVQILLDGIHLFGWQRSLHTRLIGQLCHSSSIATCACMLPSCQSSAADSTPHLLLGLHLNRIVQIVHEVDYFTMLLLSLELHRLNLSPNIGHCLFRKTCAPTRNLGRACPATRFWRQVGQMHRNLRCESFHDVLHTLQALVLQLLGGLVVDVRSLLQVFLSLLGMGLSIHHDSIALIHGLLSLLLCSLDILESLEPLMFHTLIEFSLVDI